MGSRGDEGRSGGGNIRSRGVGVERRGSDIGKELGFVEEGGVLSEEWRKESFRLCRRPVSKRICAERTNGRTLTIASKNFQLQREQRGVESGDS